VRLRGGKKEEAHASSNLETISEWKFDGAGPESKIRANKRKHEYTHTQVAQVTGRSNLLPGTHYGVLRGARLSAGSAGGENR